MLYSSESGAGSTDPNLLSTPLSVHAANHSHAVETQRNWRAVNNRLRELTEILEVRDHPNSAAALENSVLRDYVIGLQWRNAEIHTEALAPDGNGPVFGQIHIGAQSIVLITDVPFYRS